MNDLFRKILVFFDKFVTFLLPLITRRSAVKKRKQPLFVSAAVPCICSCLFHIFFYFSIFSNFCSCPLYLQLSSLSAAVFFSFFRKVLKRLLPNQGCYESRHQNACLRAHRAMSCVYAFMCACVYVCMWVCVYVYVCYSPLSLGRCGEDLCVVLKVSVGSTANCLQKFPALPLPVMDG